MVITFTIARPGLENALRWRMNENTVGLAELYSNLHTQVVKDRTVFAHHNNLIHYAKGRVV